MRGYKATVDGPAGEDFAFEMASLFPNAKVLLSVRDSDEVWHRSFKNTIGVQYGDSWRTFFYRVTMYPVGFLWKVQLLCDALGDRWGRVYGGPTPKMHSSHNAMIKAGIPAERLLVFNVKEGWEPLCRFLGKPVPDVEFPRINDAKSVNRILRGIPVFGFLAGAMYLVAFSGPVYLAFKPDLARALALDIWWRVGSLTSLLSPSS
jgi:hypothetical protein